MKIKMAVMALVSVYRRVTAPEYARESPYKFIKAVLVLQLL